jgi:hypothetical protein
MQHFRLKGWLLCSAANVILEIQDLKQQKFVIEAEPSELVRIPMHVASNMDSLRELEKAACGTWTRNQADRMRHNRFLM